MIRRTSLLAILAALPVSIAATGEDGSATSQTILRLTGGSGSFALIDRGCEGALSAQSIDFEEAAFLVSHRMGNVSVAIRGGILETTAPTPDDLLEVDPEFVPRLTRYAGPYFTLHADGSEFGVGPIFAEGPFPDGRGGQKIEAAAHMQIGNERRHLRVGWMDHEPLYAGGGKFLVGISAPMAEWLDGYFGIGGSPFDQAGAVLRARIYPVDPIQLEAGLRMGSSEGIDETAGWVGVALLRRN